MFQRLSPAVKNILIINVLVFLATYAISSFDFNRYFGLHYYASQYYSPYQFISFMFMHAGLTHVFFNMFAVFMFGPLIENALGTKRFLIYYFTAGIGSGIIQQAALYCDITPFIQDVDHLLSDLTTENLNDFLNGRGAVFNYESQVAMGQFINKYNGLININPAQAQTVARDFLVNYQQLFIDSHVTVGASGAVFGLLFAFGYLFPNMRVMLLFPPIPLKAKWMVIGYGAIELFSGIANSSYDNVAHWAHLGGMLFGFILFRIWRTQKLD